MNFKPGMTSILGAMALSGSMLTAPAQAVEGFSVSAGNGEDIDFYRVAARFDWDKKWFDESGDWFLTGHHEIGVLYMDADSSVTTDPSAEDNLYGLFFTPVLRFQRDPFDNDIAPFAEIGIGAAYLSEDHLKNDTVGGTDLGGNFQFENKVSVGMMFGQEQNYELAVNYFHYSNAGIEDPNGGIDLIGLSFSMWY